MATTESDAAAHAEEHEEDAEEHDDFSDVDEEFAQMVHVPRLDLPEAREYHAPHGYPAPGVAAAAAAAAVPPKESGKLSEQERRAQICVFLSRYVDPKKGKPIRGATRWAAEEFDTSMRHIYSVWTRNKQKILHPDKYKIDGKRKKGSGRKHKRSPEEVRALVRAVPCRYRHSVRTLAERTGIPRSTLNSFLKKYDQELYRSLRSTKTDDDDGDGAGGTEAPRPPPGEDDHLHREAQKRRTEAQKIGAELKEYYEVELDRTVERAKREARERHTQHLEELPAALQQEQFDSEKEKVLYQLRLEMDRHSLELNRLKGALDKIGKVRNGDEEEMYDMSV